MSLLLSVTQAWNLVFISSPSICLTKARSYWFCSSSFSPITLIHPNSNCCIFSKSSQFPWAGQWWSLNPGLLARQGALLTKLHPQPTIHFQWSSCLSSPLLWTWTRNYCVKLEAVPRPRALGTRWGWRLSPCLESITGIFSRQGPGMLRFLSEWDDPTPRTAAQHSPALGDRVSCWKLHVGT